MVYGKGKRQVGTKSRKAQRDNAKKIGKKADMAEFRQQLDALGLKIVEVTADGNCLFRSLADQLEGEEDKHAKYRAMVVEFIVAHQQDFEPFIEDEVPFDEYCRSMGDDGTWAGHMELQAASLLTRRNICIHKLSSPRWYIKNFNSCKDSMIHLCYHDGEHYNSVRLKEDPCHGPAMPVTIKEDIDFSMESYNPNAADDKPAKSAEKPSCSTNSVDLVMAATGCNDFSKVKQVLQDMEGDADGAIECLLAMQISSELSHPDDLLTNDDYNEVEQSEDCRNSVGQTSDKPADTSNGKWQSTSKSQSSSGRSEASSSKSQNLSGKSQISQSQKANGFDSSHVKKPSKISECSCGTAKKHKPSCNLSTMRSSKTPAVKGKGAQARVKSRKYKYIDTPPIEVRHRERPIPDLGALCI